MYTFSSLPYYAADEYRGYFVTSSATAHVRDTYLECACEMFNYRLQGRLVTFASRLPSKVGGYYAMIHNCAQGEESLHVARWRLARNRKMTNLVAADLQRVTDSENSRRHARRPSPRARVCARNKVPRSPVGIPFAKRPAHRSSCDLTLKRSCADFNDLLHSREI